MTKGNTNKKYNDNKIENNFYIKKKKSKQLWRQMTKNEQCR